MGALKGRIAKRKPVEGVPKRTAGWVGDRRSRGRRESRRRERAAEDGGQAGRLPEWGARGGVSWGKRRQAAGSVRGQTRRMGERMVATLGELRERVPAVGRSGVEGVGGGGFGENETDEPRAHTVGDSRWANGPRKGRQHGKVGVTGPAAT